MPTPGVDDAAARFELKGLLGRGGMGRVLRAHDRALGREVALKLMPLAGRDATQVERFQREGQITARLDHPGIVRVHSAGLLGREAYLAYELVEGARPLDEAWQGVPRAQRVGWVLEAARALAHAHARGVIHRDVKPGNVLVDDQGRVRVTDFGLARATGLTPLTREGAFMGTPFWLAPEGFNGQPLGPAGDVWALGVMLYQALTDALPFDGQSLTELAGRIGGEPPLRPRELDPDVPAPLEALALLALDKDPARRPADAQAFASLLEGALAGDAPRAARPLPAGLLAGGLLLAALALGVALGLGPRAGQPAPSDPGPPPPPVAAPSDPAPPIPATRALGWVFEQGQRTRSHLRVSIDRKALEGADLDGVYTLDLDLEDEVRAITRQAVERLMRITGMRLDARMGVPLRLNTENEAGQRTLYPFLEQPFVVQQDPRTGRVHAAIGVSDARQQVLRSAEGNFQSVLELVTDPLNDEVFAAGLSLLWGLLPEQGEVVEGRPWALEGLVRPWSDASLPWSGQVRLEGRELRCETERVIHTPAPSGKVLAEPQLEVWQRWGAGGVLVARAQLRVEERRREGRARLRWLLELNPPPPPGRRSR